MPVQPINIIGGAYADDNRPWSAQDTVNWLPVTAEMPGARSGEMLRTPPGLRPFAGIGSRWRGLRNVEGRLFGVSGQKAYQIYTDGTYTELGSCPGRGLVSITHNQITGGNEVVFGNGDAGYVYNTVSGAYAQITDDAFPGFLVCDYINSRIVGIEPGRRYWFHSELADATSYSDLHRYESEASPDRLRGIIVSHLETWLLNERTIEVFENTGAENAIFENKRIVIEVGCAATHTARKLDNSIVFLGHDGSVYQTEGYGIRRISTHAMEQAISRCQMSKASALVWEDRGHKVYYLTFPDGYTWGFDFATRQWHRRQSEGMDRWRLSCLVRWNDDWYGGAYNSGVLYRLDWDYHLEGTDRIARERTTPCLHNHQNRVIADSLELVFDTGGDPTAAVQITPQSESFYWAESTLDHAVQNYAIAVSQHTIVTVNHGGDVEYSYQSGTDWTDAGGSWSDPYVSAVYNATEGAFYVAQQGVTTDIWKATDDGTPSFANVKSFQAPSGASTNGVGNIVTANGEIFALVTYPDGAALRFYRRVSDASWTLVSTAIAPGVGEYFVSAAWDGTYYVFLTSAGRTIRTTDLSAFTDAGTLGAAPSTGTGVCSDGAGTCLAKISTGWLKSVDGGDNWSATGDNTSLAGLVWAHDKWWGSYYGDVYSSDDDGASFTREYERSTSGAYLGIIAAGPNDMLAVSSGHLMTVYRPTAFASTSTSSADTDDHHVYLTVSRDGAHTFGAWSEHDLGEAGDFMKLVTRRRLGTARHMVVKIRTTSPIRTDLISASASIASEQ